MPDEIEIDLHVRMKGDNEVADFTALEAALTAVQSSLSDADQREAAEQGADQATVDAATQTINAMKAHIDSFDATPAAPAPAPAPLGTTTGEPAAAAVPAPAGLPSDPGPSNPTPATSASAPDAPTLAPDATEAPAPDAGAVPSSEATDAPAPDPSSGATPAAQ